MIQYGISTSPDYASVDSYIYKRWFNTIFEWVRSRIEIKTTTVAYTVTANIYYVRGDATAGAIAVTLPPAINNTGRQVFVKKIDASGNAVTVTAAGADTIEGAATAVLAAQWAKTLLISNGNATWEKIV